MQNELVKVETHTLKEDIWKDNLVVKLLCD